MSESTDLQRAVERLTDTVERLRSELVSKETYTAGQLAAERDNAARDRATQAEVKRIDKDVADLETLMQADRDARKADRRLVAAAGLAFLGQFLFDIYSKVPS